MEKEVLGRLTELIEAPCEATLAAALARQSTLAKPPGSLGRLERIGNQLAAISRTCPPPVPTKAVVGVFAGDHGIAAYDLSTAPPIVTALMLANMSRGGASINVLARSVGATVQLTDVGVLEDYPPADTIRDRNVARGTRDFTFETAMTEEDTISALVVGLEAADEAVASGADILLTGEMGICNTTPSAALISVFTGRSVADVTGTGAGIDDATLARKIDVINRGLDLHHPSADDPIGALGAVGGLEIAALAGFILGGALHQVPVVLDGVIAVAAACVAAAMAPAAKGYLIAGHAGVEPGIQAGLAHLELEPVIDLGLRLGEGSGAVLVLPVVQAAARILREVATFEEAGIAL